MEAIKITVTGADAQVRHKPLLTCGMVGVPVEFTFDEGWQGLRKTAVFRVGMTTLDVLDLDTVCTVPHELLLTPYRTLRIGVYGCTADGSLVIPTVWADAGQILPGADPSGDESTEPSPSVWEQVTGIVQEAKDVAQSIREDADEGVFKGEPGKSIHFIDDYPIVTPTGYFSVDIPEIPNVQIGDLVLFTDWTIGIIKTIKTPIGGKVIGNLKGQDGANGYTPVRGKDYWTDTDKAEIKSYVDEAILGGAW